MDGSGRRAPIAASAPARPIELLAAEGLFKPITTILLPPSVIVWLGVWLRLKRATSAFPVAVIGRCPVAELRELSKSRESRYSVKLLKPAGSRGALALISRQRCSPRLNT